MSARTTLAFVVGVAIGLAAGAGAGLLLAAFDEVPADGARRDPLSAPTRGTPADDEPSGPAAPRAAARARATSDAGDAAPAPAAPMGRGWISGTVVDADGTPVAGVRVSVVPDADDTEDDGTPIEDLPPDEALREEIRVTLAEIRRRHARTFRAVTDAAGGFRVTGLPEKPCSVGLASPQWTFTRVGGGIWDYVRPGSVLQYVATARLTIPLDVTMPSGERAQAASVEWSRGDGDGDVESQTWSASSPKLDLNPGEWRIRATKGDYSEYESEWVRVEVRVGKPPAPVTLRLRENPAVMGRLIAGGDTQTASLRVGLCRVTDGEASDRELLESSEREWVVPGDAFGFTGLDDGTWVLFAATRARRIVAREQVTVAGGIARRDLRLPAGDLGDSCVVRVVGPDGRGVPDPSFQMRVATEQQSAGGDVDAAPLGDGRYRVPLMDFDAPESEWSSSRGNPDEATSDDVKSREVVVTSPTLGEASAVIPSDGSEVTVRFGAAATLIVGIDVGPGDSARRMSLRVSRDDDRGRRQLRVIDVPVDADARRRTWRCGPIAAGPVSIRLEFVTKGWDRLLLPPVSHTLGAGENRVDLAPPVIQPLRVAVPDGSDADDLRLWWIAPDDRESVDADEREGQDVSWRELPAGKYRLEHSELGFMEFSLPGPSSMRFAARAVNAIRAGDFESGTAAWAEGFRPGDLIVALDGQEFRNREHARAAWALARSNGRAKVTIHRGSQRIELDVARFREADDEMPWDFDAR